MVPIDQGTTYKDSIRDYVKACFDVGHPKMTLHSDKLGSNVYE